LQEVFYI